jgi:hypothetical protein
MINLLYKFLPTFLVISSLAFAGLSSNFLNTQMVSTSRAQNSDSKEGVLGAEQSRNITSDLTETPTPKSTLKPTPVSVIIPSVTQTPTPTPEPRTIITNNYITVVATPTPQPSPTSSPISSPSPTPTPTPTNISTVSIQVRTPAANSEFDIQFENTIDACDILVKAKDEGKIASVTLDDSYLSSFNTLLVTEINGFSNYWVFTVNGESPMGCSLINLNDNDQVIWEFINGDG